MTRGSPLDIQLAAVRSRSLLRVAGAAATGTTTNRYGLAAVASHLSDRPMCSLQCFVVGICRQVKMRPILRVAEQLPIMRRENDGCFSYSKGFGEFVDERN